MGITENEELSYFVTYASIVLLKLIIMSPLTGGRRIQNKVMEGRVNFFI